VAPLSIDQKIGNVPSFEGATSPHKEPRLLLLSLLVSALIVALIWLPILHFDSAPAGDGRRIVPFLKFVHAMKDHLALWNPYRNGGFPLLGDAENYWFPAVILDPTSQHVNFILNLILFAESLVCVVPLWLIARRLRLNAYWAVLLVVTLSVNEHVFVLHQWGWIITYVDHIALLFTVWALLAEKPGPIENVVIILGHAVFFAFAGYYALIPIVMTVSALALRGRRDWSRPYFSFFTILGHAGVLAFAGLLLSSPLSGPLITHVWSSHVPIQHLSYEPNVPASALSYARLLVPFFPADPILVSFTSLTLLPALMTRPLGPTVESQLMLRIFAPFYVWGLVFVVGAAPWVGPWVRDAYSILPIVSGVRWFRACGDVLQLVLTAAAFALCQRHEGRTIAVFGPLSRCVLGLYFLISGIYTVAMVRETGVLVGLLAAVGLFLLGAYALITIRIDFGIRRIESFSLKGFMGVLVALTMVANIAELMWNREPFIDIDLYTTNAPQYPALENAIESDSDPYFRYILDFDNAGMSISAAQKRSTMVFSLYYPKGFAYSLAYISSHYNISQMRPHWINSVGCDYFDPVALELFGIKYIMCAEALTNPILSARFLPVGTDSGKTLYRDQQYKGGIHFFCKWRAFNAPPPEQARNDVLDSYGHGIAIVTPEGAKNLPASDETCDNATTAAAAVTEDRPGHMVISVSTPRPGMIVIPDNYDKDWQAEANGHPVAVIKAFHAYLSVPVAAGSSVIVLDYRDRAFALFRWVGLIDTLGILGYLAFSWKRKTLRRLASATP